MSSHNDVAIVMGSQSDWETMQHTVTTLQQLKISYHAQVISAHRTPQLLYDFAAQARAEHYKVIIAGAGGAAHLPGMFAAVSDLPVLGVPIKSQTLAGMDSLLSIVQMPAGVPVGTLSIGRAGAINAALLAAAILANDDVTILQALQAYRKMQTDQVLNNVTVGKQ